MSTQQASPAGTHMEEEIASQPECWTRAAALGARGVSLPAPGERVAVVGCGTSWFMAQSYAAEREALGLGETDAFAASETPRGRRYDRVVAITRSGTTTEVLELLQGLPESVPSVALVGDTETPIVDLAGEIVALGFADERSVVQTRFATSALVLLRASLGIDAGPAVEDAARALDAELDPELAAAEQTTYLGTGWTVGLAHEAALKMREASQSWTESYPAKEYRHGPVSIAAPGRNVWLFGDAPVGLPDEVARTGARFVHHPGDPLASLVTAQRVALARARAAGLDPDAPRNLTRSVVLDK